MVDKGNASNKLKDKTLSICGDGEWEDEIRDDGTTCLLNAGISLRTMYRKKPFYYEVDWYDNTITVVDVKPDGLITIVSRESYEYDYAWDYITMKKWGMRTVEKFHIKRDGIVKIPYSFFHSGTDLRFLARDSSFSRRLKQVIEKQGVLKTKRDKNGHPVLLPDLYLTDGEVYYGIRLEVDDYSGRIGKCKYESLCDFAGVPTPDKKSMDDHKRNMRKYKTEAVNEYNDGKQDKLIQWYKYTMGDLLFPEIAKGLTHIAEKVTEGLDVSFEFRPTIGSSVSKLLENWLDKRLGLDGVSLPNEQWSYMENGELKPVDSNITLYKMLNTPITSASLLKESARTTPLTARWLAKTDGGRASNNIPHNIAVLNEPCLDEDIGGAYASILCHSYLSFGRPTISHYTENYKITLRQFFNKYGKYLVDGMWYLRLSGTLSFHQDILESQLLPDLEKMEDFIKNKEGDEEIKKIDGTLVVLSKEVKHATLTSEKWKLIQHCVSRKEKRELLDCKVDCYAFYDKRYEVDSPKEVVEALNNYKPNPYPYYQTDEGESESSYPEYWYRIPLLEFVVPLLNLRKTYSKNKSSPEFKFNLTYKLILNTIYGVLCSPYFAVSNVITSNNITSNIRTLVWAMKCGLDLQQCITDGGSFRVNAVRQAPSLKSLEGLALANYHMESFKVLKQHRSEYIPGYRPLFDEPVRLDKGKLIGVNTDKAYAVVEENGKAVTAVLDTLALNHVIEFFDGCDSQLFIGDYYKVKPDPSNLEKDEFGLPILTSEYLATLNHYEVEPGKGWCIFEGKAVYNGMLFHGKSDYQFLSANGKRETKYRGVNPNLVFREYGKGKTDYHSIFEDCIDPDGNRLTAPKEILENPSPVKDYFYLLELGVELFPVLPYASYFHPVSVGDYNPNYPHRQIGDPKMKPLRIRPFNVSQFLYPTEKVRQSWSKCHDKRFSKQGLGVESIFIDEGKEYLIRGVSYPCLNLQVAINKLSETIIQGGTPKDLGLSFRKSVNYIHPLLEPAKVVHFVDDEDDILDIDSNLE